MLFVNRSERETERLTENLKVDGHDGTDENVVDVSALHSNGKTTVNINNDEIQSVVSSHHGTTLNSQTLSSAERTSTVLTSVCLTVKLEPSVEEQNNSTSRCENNRHCHDSMTDDVTASRCVQRDDGRLNDQPVHFTTSYPSVSFSHRPDCPCGPLPSISSSSNNTRVEEGRPRRRRRQSGLSRLRRTELRRRSRTAMVTEDLANGVDGVNGTASVAIAGVDHTAPSDVISAELRTSLGGQDCSEISDAFSKFKNTACEVAMKPDNTTSTVQSTSTQTTTSTTSARMTNARQSTENLRPSDNESKEKAIADLTIDRRVTNLSTSVKRKRPLTTTEPADCISTAASGVFPAVSTWSHDVSKMPTTNNEAAPLNVWQRLDSDVASLSNAFNTSTTVPLTPLLRGILTQSVVNDTATGNVGHSSIVDAPRCYVGSAVKWRRCYGDVEKQRDIVMWMQTRGVALTAPVLRCALTVLKYNTVALVNSPACYISRRVPIIYPRYRLLCYPPSPCV